MQTGTSRPSARTRFTTWMPSRSGIVTSRTTTAGPDALICSSASRPPAAVETAKPSRRSARSRACRTEASSSTTRTSGSALRASTPPMMRRPDRERVLDLLDVDLQTIRQRLREPVAPLLVLRLVLLAELVERRLQLGLVDAQLLGERGGVRPAAAARATRAATAGATRTARVHLVERRLQLVLGHAELLRQRRQELVTIGAGTGALVRAGLLQGRANLGSAHAELLGQCRRDVAHVIARAPRALRPQLVERRLDLRLIDAQLAGQAGRKPVARVTGRRLLVLPDVLERRLEVRGGNAELVGQV